MELFAFAAAAIASTQWPTAALIGLFAAGSLARWRRGLSWAGEPAGPGLVLGGAAVGVAALALAVVVAAPVVESVTARAVEWTDTAVVRGSAIGLVTMAMLVGARAVAAALVFDRWLIDRVIERGGTPALAALAAAVAEGAVTGGHLAARLGAALAGLGFALVYLGAGRRLAAANACRLTFELGALTLVSLKLL